MCLFWIVIIAIVFFEKILQNTCKGKYFNLGGKNKLCQKKYCL